MLDLNLLKGLENLLKTIVNLILAVCLKALNFIPHKTIKVRVTKIHTWKEDRGKYSAPIERSKRIALNEWSDRSVGLGLYLYIKSNNMEYKLNNTNITDVDFDSIVVSFRGRYW